MLIACYALLEVMRVLAARVRSYNYVYEKCVCLPPLGPYCSFGSMYWMFALIISLFSRLERAAEKKCMNYSKTQFVIILFVYMAISTSCIGHQYNRSTHNTANGMVNWCNPRSSLVTTSVLCLIVNVTQTRAVRMDVIGYCLIPKYI